MRILRNKSGGSTQAANENTRHKSTANQKPRDSGRTPERSSVFQKLITRCHFAPCVRCSADTVSLASDVQYHSLIDGPAPGTDDAITHSSHDRQTQGQGHSIDNFLFGSSHRRTYAGAVNHLTTTDYLLGNLSEDDDVIEDTDDLILSYDDLENISPSPPEARDTLDDCGSQSLVARRSNQSVPIYHSQFNSNSLRRRNLNQNNTIPRNKFSNSAIPVLFSPNTGSWLPRVSLNRRPIDEQIPDPAQSHLHGSSPTHSSSNLYNEVIINERLFNDLTNLSDTQSQNSQAVGDNRVNLGDNRGNLSDDASIANDINRVNTTSSENRHNSTGNEDASNENTSNEINCDLLFPDYNNHITETVAETTHPDEVRETSQNSFTDFTLDDDHVITDDNHDSLAARQNRRNQHNDDESQNQPETPRGEESTNERSLPIHLLSLFEGPDVLLHHSTNSQQRLDVLDDEYNSDTVSNICNENVDDARMNSLATNNMDRSCLPMLPAPVLGATPAVYPHNSDSSTSSVQRTPLQQNWYVYDPRLGAQTDRDRLNMHMAWRGVSTQWSMPAMMGPPQYDQLSSHSQEQNMIPSEPPPPYTLSGTQSISSSTIPPPYEQQTAATSAAAEVNTIAPPPSYSQAVFNSLFSQFERENLCSGRSLDAVNETESYPVTAGDNIGTMGDNRRNLDDEGRVLNNRGDRNLPSSGFANLHTNFSRFRLGIQNNSNFRLFADDLQEGREAVNNLRAPVIIPNSTQQTLIGIINEENRRQAGDNTHAHTFLDSLPANITPEDDDINQLDNEEESDNQSTINNLIQEDDNLDSAAVSNSNVDGALAGAHFNQSWFRFRPRWGTSSVQNPVTGRMGTSFYS